MKKDGDSIDSFYKKCGSVSPTMLFFKTVMGHKFGGYTTQIWPIDGSKGDKNSFVFSLDKKMKYKVNNPSASIIGRK